MVKKPDPWKVAREEWDFALVPDEELQTCIFYEYARECMSFIGYQLERWLAAKMSGDAGSPNEEAARRVKLLREILSVIRAEGFDEKRFLGRYYDTDCGYAQLYDFLRDNVTPFSRAWTTLPGDARAFLDELTKRRKAFFPPLKPAYVQHLEELWAENSRELVEARERAKGTEYDGDDGAELFAETKALLAKPGHGGDTHGETVAAFAVDFKRHNNAAIAEAFSAWLVGNRPADCPEPTLVGKKRIDLRFDLKCLGAMRLLHWCTFEEIDKAFPEVWQSNQYEGRKWYDANKWYEARRHAMRTYHEAFPFLDEAEQPLHYQTAGERRKRGLPTVPAKWPYISKVPGKRNNRGGLTQMGEAC